MRFKCKALGIVLPASIENDFFLIICELFTIKIAIENYTYLII